MGINAAWRPGDAEAGGRREAGDPECAKIYHKSSLGPSYQQGWVMEPADGNRLGSRGSIDEGAAHHIDSTVQAIRKTGKILNSLSWLIPGLFRK
jgi:hypothetical protein